jgi:tellurite resistance protein TehA-like permease
VSHLAIEIGIRFVVFALAFWLAARKLEQVTIEPRWATPLVGLAFAALNVGLYWVLKPILAVATLGLFGFAVPFVLNGLFLWATVRLVAKLRARVEIDGAMALVKMSVILTLTHGLLWIALQSFRA